MPKMLVNIGRFLLVIGVLSLLFALMALANSVQLAAMSAGLRPPGAALFNPQLAYINFGLQAVAGAVYIVAGLGIRKAKGWAKWLYIVVTPLYILAGFALTYSYVESFSFDLTQLIGLAIYGFIVWQLTRPEHARLFENR